MSKKSSPIYIKWYDMLRLAKKKGVDVYEPWKTFEIFENWAKDNNFQIGNSISRLDKTKGFFPDNLSVNKLQNKKKDALYQKWYDMLKLVETKNTFVYEPWKEFNNFKTWALENGFETGHKLNRLDKTKGFVPGNLTINKTIDRKKEPLFGRWAEIKLRAKEINVEFYENWLDYEKFKEWAYNNGFQKSLTLARPDKSKGYIPGNVVFVPFKGGGYKHGLSNHRLYHIWQQMLERCYNPNTTHYERYGGRGISVCEEWRNNYLSFYYWAMSNGYKDGLTIEREDFDGNYEPKNCSWKTMQEQANNRSTNVFIEINGVTKTVSQWAKEYDLSSNAISYRLSQGITGEDLLAPSDRGKNRALLTVAGETKSLKEWSDITGLSVNTIRKRMHKNWEEDRILSKLEPKLIEFKGEYLTITELSERTNIPTGTLRDRYFKMNMRDEKLVSEEKLNSANLELGNLSNDKLSFEELSRLTGIPASTLKNRYHRSNLRGEELIKPVKDKKRYIEFKGELKTFAQLSEEYGIKINTLKDRYANNKRDDDLIAPVKKPR